MKKILKYNKSIVIIILLITLFFLFQIPKVEINNDIKVFLPDDHVSKVSNREIERIFGESDNLAAAVGVKEGSIFESYNLEKISNLTDDLESISDVDEVTSITNVDFIEGTSQGMLVEELVKDIPETEAERYEIKEKIMSWDFYKNNLYSEDFKASQLLITLKDSLSTEAKNSAYYEIKEITESYQDSRFSTYIAGAAAVNARMGDSMMQDIRLLIPFIIIVLAAVLYLFFQSLMPVFLIMLTVVISSIWSVGLMAYLGINLTLVSTVIPVLLIAVGSAYGIHILSHYYDYLSEIDGALSDDEHQEIVFKTINQLGKPVFLAALTTAVGFASLASSEIVPIRSFGIFTAIGITAAFITAVFLIPSLLILIREYSSNNSEAEYQKLEHFESTIAFLHNFYSRRRFQIIVLVIVIIFVSIFGFNKIIIDTPLIEMFKEDSEIRQADQFINGHFAGTTIMNILIEGDERGSLNNPEILKEMDNLQNYISGNFAEVGKVSSIVNFVKRMNQVMHYPEEEIDQSESVAQSSQNNNETSQGGMNSFYEGDESSEEDKSSQEGMNSFYEGDESSGEDKPSQDGMNSFYEEDESSGNGMDSFYEDDGVQDSQADRSESGDGIILAGPGKEKNISEYQFAELLSRSLARADRLGLNAEELVNLIKEEMNYKAAAYYEIPYDTQKYGAESKQNLQNLISQYLLLYSGNLDDMINDPIEPDKAQMLLQLNTPSTITADKVSREIEAYRKDNFPENYKLTVSGNARMALAANNLIISSQIKSIIISFAVVFIIVAFSFKSFIAGIYGIIPLAFSLIINFALMGYTGIKLDVGTAMVASIAIGIGVDYTIHFLHSYHHHRQKNDDLHIVSRKTLTSTGKAVIFNAISVAAGFLVLLFSNFYPLVYLGLLIAVTMFTSSLAALTLLPMLLNIFKPKFISKKL